MSAQKQPRESNFGRETDGQRMREFAATTLLALEELRRVTGVDEWDEGDWRTLSYNEAWEVLGEDRAQEVLRETTGKPWVHPDDTREALDQIDRYAATDMDHELHAVVEHWRGVLGVREEAK